MRVGIFYKIGQADEDTVSRLVFELRERGADVDIFTSADAISSIDRLLVLGGDGTMLHAARQSAELGIPLIGINYGTLGFLTEFEREQALDAVDLVLDPECDTVERSMLEVSLDGKKFYCLNEMSLLRRATPEGGRVVKISVQIDDSNAGEFTADGLILATPTGSTAYSLSAGGSIMTPDCQTFMLTPVCAFSLRSRSIACSDKSTISFGFERNACSVLVYGDGIFLGEATRDTRLSVKRASRTAVFLTRDRRGFFRRLTDKIN